MTTTARPGFAHPAPAYRNEKVPPMPAWCRGAGDSRYPSYVFATGANMRSLQSPSVYIADDVSLHLYQSEESLNGCLTHTPVAVRLWGADESDPIDLTAEQAQAFGLAMIEHAMRLRDVQETAANTL